MDIKSRVSAGFQGQGFMALLGATLTEVKPGEWIISLPFTTQLTQQHGFFHGGVTATLADNAAGFAGYTLMSVEEQPLSVEFKINFMAPADGSSLKPEQRLSETGDVSSTSI